MAEVRPWLTIVGIGEDGAARLSPASRAALEHAEIVTGAARHLALLGGIARETRVWPVPFEDGIAPLLALRGQRVVLLASGDPFWFGAGSVVTRRLERHEWVAHPAPSVFALAAARHGWALEETVCLGLHARALSQIRPHLAAGQRLIVLGRDGAATIELAERLTELGFGASDLHLLEALGGPRERIRSATAATLAFDDIAHPVAVAITVSGGPALPRCSGLPDSIFEHDGQLTKRPIRALALSALAPVAGEMLWDIGAGAGSIAIEWLLAHRATRAIAFEADPARASRIRANSLALGVDRLQVIEGRAPESLADRASPDAVFVGGGLSEDVLRTLWSTLAPGTRVVVHAVTLESEALVGRWHAAKGGTLLRIALSQAAPLGRRRGWQASYPVLQWAATA